MRYVFVDYYFDSTDTVYRVDDVLVPRNILLHLTRRIIIPPEFPFHEIFPQYERVIRRYVRRTRRPIN